MDDLSIESILNNHLSKIYYDYESSLIQLSIPQTYETINIGVVLKDTKGVFQIETIPSVFKLSSCLNLDNLSGIDYALKIFTDRVLTYKTVTYGKVSEILTITQPFAYTSDKEAHIAAKELFRETVTIMKGMGEKQKTINHYDKPHILTSLKEVVKRNKYTNIEFNKQISHAHKRIDTVTFASKKPIVAAEIVSPYVADFLRNFGESLIVMQELNANTDLKHKLIYMPVLQEMTATQRKNYQTTLSIATNNNIEVNSSSDYAEFLGQIEEITKPYSGQLL